MMRGKRIKNCTKLHKIKTKCKKCKKNKKNRQNAKNCQNAKKCHFTKNCQKSRPRFSGGTDFLPTNEHILHTVKVA